MFYRTYCGSVRELEPTPIGMFNTIGESHNSSAVSWFFVRYESDCQTLARRGKKLRASVK